MTNKQPPTVRVGGRTMYVDSKCDLHLSAQETISANMRAEGDLSRGVSGGCNQDAEKVPEKTDWRIDRQLNNF